MWFFFFNFYSKYHFNGLVQKNDNFFPLVLQNYIKIQEVQKR